jgi:hypothetical protein
MNRPSESEAVRRATRSGAELLSPSSAERSGVATPGSELFSEPRDPRDDDGGRKTAPSPGVDRAEVWIFFAGFSTEATRAAFAAFGVGLRGVGLLSAFRFFSAPLSGLGGSAPPRLRLATDAGDCRNCANVWSTGCVKSTEKSLCSARLRRKKHTTKKL